MRRNEEDNVDASTIRKAYVEEFGVTEPNIFTRILMAITGQSWESPFYLADKEYKEVDEELIQMILDADLGDKEDYETEWYDCEVPIEEAYGLGLFYADGSCGLRKEDSLSGAWWRIVNWKLDSLERTQKAFEQHWEELTFPIRLYDDYKEGSDTNYGARKKSLYCLEVAPRERHNDGSRGQFIKKFRATAYDKFGNKKVPAGILESPPISKRAFLEGAIDGDGTMSKTNYSGKLTCHGIMQVTELMDLMLDSGWKFNFGRDNGNENYWITFRKGKKLRATPACDDFAFRLMGMFHVDRDAAAMPIFVTWVSTPQGGHAVLSYFDGSGVKIIEPQNDEIFNVPENWGLILLCG